MVTLPNWVPTPNQLGVQPILATNAANPSQYQTGQSPFFGQEHPLGTIIQAYDTSTLALGQAEFIYLRQTSSDAVGSAVVYDVLNATTTLAPNTANLAEPLAFSPVANTATGYGWFQISGVVQAKKINTAPVSKSAAVYLSATAGSITGVAANGKQILNARSVASAASAASYVDVLVQRPFAQGQTT